MAEITGYGGTVTLGGMSFAVTSWSASWVKFEPAEDEPRVQYMPPDLAASVVLGWPFPRPLAHWLAPLIRAGWNNPARN